MRTSAADRRSWLQWALGLSCGWVAGAAAASAFDLPALAALLAPRQQAQVSFTEERFIGGMEQSLLSSGTLSFSAPDRLERHTLWPRPESMVADGQQLSLTRGGRKRQIAMDAMPELAPLIEAARATLSGDLSRLKSHFNIQLEGSATKWRLVLVPLDSPLRGQVLQVELQGQESQLRSIELKLAGGDRSVMVLGAPTPSRPAPP